MYYNPKKVQFKCKSLRFIAERTEMQHRVADLGLRLTGSGPGGKITRIWIQPKSVNLTFSSQYLAIQIVEKKNNIPEMTLLYSSLYVQKLISY